MVHGRKGYGVCNCTASISTLNYNYQLILHQENALA